MMAWRTSSGSSRHGVSRSKPISSPRPSQHMPIVVAGALGQPPGLDGALVDRLVRIGNHQFGVDLQTVADAGALRAGAVRGVERERTRFDLRRVPAGGRSGRRRFSENGLRRFGSFSSRSHEIGHHNALGQTQRGLDRIGQTLTDAVADHQTVDDHLDRMLLLLGQLDLVGQLVHSRRRSARAHSRRRAASPAGPRTRPCARGPPARGSGNGCAPDTPAAYRPSAAGSAR